MQSGTTMVEVTPIACVLQISHQPKTASGPIIFPLSATPPRFTTLMAVLAQSQQFVRRLELLLLAVSGHATQCQTAKQQMPWRGKKQRKEGAHSRHCSRHLSVVERAVSGTSRWLTRCGFLPILRLGITCCLGGGIVKSISKSSSTVLMSKLPLGSPTPAPTRRRAPASTPSPSPSPVSASESVDENVDLLDWSSSERLILQLSFLLDQPQDCCGRLRSLRS